MSNIRLLEDFLMDKQIKYELIKHNRPIRSAEDGAKYFGIDIGQTVPTIIVSVDDSLYAIIMSGKRNKLDFEKLRKLLNADSVKLASKETILNELGYTIGNVPMVNLPIPCILDKELLRYSFVYGGTGIKNITLKIDPHILFQLNKIHITSVDI